MLLMENLRQHPLVAIVRLDDLSKADGLVKALYEGGIRFVEFTLTNPAALDTVRQMRRQTRLEGLSIGVGSVIRLEQAQESIEAGAQFVVAPILMPEVIRYCVTKDIPIMPGAFSPTEIYQAQDLGASVVKIFPARHLGAAYIKDILAPMPDLRLMPTGGVNLENVSALMEAGSFCVGLGSSLIDPLKIAQEDWDGLRETAQAFVNAVVV